MKSAQAAAWPFKGPVYQEEPEKARSSPAPALPAEMANRRAFSRESSSSLGAEHGILAETIGSSWQDEEGIPSGRPVVAG